MPKRGGNLLFLYDQSENNALVNLFVGGKFDREGQLKRRAIGLERSVRPISLVLHFEDVAFKLNTGMNTV